MQITLPKFSLKGLLFIAIVAAYLFGKMFYVGGAGAAQPADVVLAGAFLLLITPSAVVRLAGVNAFLLLLMGWAVAVNFGWALATGDGEFLIGASYYAFNLGVVLAVFWTRQRNPRLFDFAVPVALVISVATQLAVVMVISTGYRSFGTFANPNQLAFWSLSAATIWVLCRPRRIGPIDLGMIGALAWIQLNSLSRAGMAAMSMLILIWLFRTIRTLRARVITLGLVILGGLLLSMTPFVSNKLAESEMVAKAEARIQKKQEMSEAEYRGYDRIFEYTGHVIIGAGEGELDRFSADRGIEIHSTFGTLIFSYGILGSVFFLAFLWRLTRVVAFDRYVYLLPSLAYGLTHNGLRFSFFWFMLGLMLSFAVTEGRVFAPRPRMVPAAPNYHGHQPVTARGPVAGG